MVLKDFLSTLESSDDSPYWLIFLGWIETMKTRKNHSYGTTSGSAAASGGPVVAATDGKGSSQVCDLFSFLTLYLISLSLLYYIFIYIYMNVYPFCTVVSANWVLIRPVWVFLMGNHDQTLELGVADLQTNLFTPSSKLWKNMASQRTCIYNCGNCTTWYFIYI